MPESIRTTRLGAIRLGSAMVLASIAVLSAAAGYGELSGVVQMPNGAHAPRATITLISSAAGVRRDLVTDADGRYSAPNLPAGSYTVVAHAAGSTDSAETTVAVKDGQKTEAAIVLSRTETPKSGALTDLPIPQRDYLDLVRQSPLLTSGQQGGNIEGYGSYSTRGNSAINSAGQRGQNNNFLVDGIDNNEMWVRGVVLAPSAESIQNARLNSTYLPPEYGHAAGAVVQVASKAGGNAFHGSVYEYFQNSVLNAANFFDRGSKPNLAQNQFGASLGGPIRRNNWFFFADVDVLRERRGLTVVSTVPSVAEKLGDFGAIPIYDPRTLAQTSPGVFTRQPLPGNYVPASRIPAAARALADLFPDPNLPGAANNYLSTPSLSEDDERYSFRTDRIFSSRNSLFARFSYGRFSGNSPGAFASGLGGGFSGSDATQQANAMNSRLATWGAALSHTLAIHPNLINEFRAGISRYDLAANPSDIGLDASDALGIAGLQDTGLPSVQVSGYTQLGAAGPTPLAIRTTSYQVEDTLSWNTPHHSWKFGFQAIRRDAFGDASEWTNRGTFSFTPDYTSQPGSISTGSALASLLFGFPAESRRDVQFSNYNLQGWEFAGFVQDEIRPFRRLSIQLGLRYSLFPPVTESKGRMVNFDFDHDDPGLNQFAGSSGVNQYAGLQVNWHNIAPRIGFAFDVFGNGSTILRGGFSKAYDTGAYLWEGSLARNAPFAARQDFFAGSLFLGRSLSDGFPIPQPTALADKDTLNAVGNSIYAIEPKAYTPYADLYGVAIQQSLRRNLTLEIGGAGSMGVHLYANTDLNQVPFPGPWTPSSRRVLWSAPLLSRIDYFDFAGGSTYYGGYARLSGRMTRDLQIQAAYTFGKSLDDAAAPASDQQSRPPGPQNLSDPGGSRSPSPFDVTQRLVIAASYDVPFRGGSGGGALQAILANWRTSAVVTAQTGLPFTPELAIDGVNNGGFQLPNRIGDGAFSASQRSYLRWFNTSLDPSNPNTAFVAPPLYQYGNGGFDTLRGPGLATVDLALARSFVLTERLRLETRAEGFNLLNRTNLALPNRILGLDSSGVISHTVTPSRQMQLIVRATW